MSLLSTLGLVDAVANNSARETKDTEGFVETAATGPGDKSTV